VDVAGRACRQVMHCSQMYTAPHPVYKYLTQVRCAGNRVV
jgi:hypothetical protein